ncbi:sensor histidine kinase [Shimazuella kribbensis]|uniref:sensor histidine kinase n=1 Tax=Shimazuella kribbensis TaxID=139808 RepID=UPI0003F70645|nr:sensor histidine kinase [Shimazuella kribbensis]
MKLFLREHLVLFFFYLKQLTIVAIVFWFGEYRNFSSLFYAVFLSISVLIIYLFYRYVRYRTYYQRLTKLPVKLEETVTPLSDASVPKKLQHLLETQYRLYKDKLYQYQAKQEKHLAFVNLWVHQMKTPLSVISLIFQEENSPVLEQIREETEKVSNGLELILYTSRLDAFEKDFQVEQIELASLLKQVLKENKRLFIKHKIFPDFQVDDQLVICSDKKWLAFVIKQILTNAVRYSAEKGQVVKIASSQQGNKISLEITDHGVGIPTEDINRVFDVHYTGRNGRKFRESTGMGLYLVREVCHRMHHQIEMESTVGIGTTLRIYFSNNHSYNNVRMVSTNSIGN